MPTAQGYGLHGVRPLCHLHQHGLVLHHPRPGPLRHAVHRGPRQEEVDLLRSWPLQFSHLQDGAIRVLAGRYLLRDAAKPHSGVCPVTPLPLITMITDT